MTWKRVLTALVLIPAVVGIVLFTPTWVVALATAGITVLALREYFALGDAIGHRAYRVWTIFCALLFVLVATNSRPAVFINLRPAGGSIQDPVWRPGIVHALRDRPELFHSPASVFFLFVIGLTCLVLWTRRPLVEVLPAAGISSSALLLVAFPLSFAIWLHDRPPDRTETAAVCVGDYLGGGYYGLFCG